MPELLGPAELAVAGVAVLLAGLVHGTLGMGFPLVSTPIIALAVDVRTAIVLTLLPTIVVNVASIARGGGWSTSIGRYWPLAAYCVAGSAAGTYFLSVSDPGPFKLLLAALILLYLVTQAIDTLDMRWVSRHFAVAMAGFGIAAGFAAGTTNVMVPILVIYTLELGLSRTQTVQVFNLCFASGKIAQIVVFAALGVIGWTLPLGALPLCMLAFAGLWAGQRLSDRIEAEAYRRMLRHILLVLAVVLIVQWALGR